jgi:hypothetical protein
MGMTRKLALVLAVWAAIRAAMAILATLFAAIPVMFHGFSGLAAI